MPDPRPYILPPKRLPADFPPTIPKSILEDVCFLAYLNREFFLCESMRGIKQRILGPVPCWEKRWAGMLGKWTQKEELEWEDVPKKRNQHGESCISRVLEIQQLRNRSSASLRKGSGNQQAAPGDTSLP